VNLEIKVITGAGKRAMKLDAGRLTVRLTARPVKGRANEELIGYVADTFGVKRREVAIISGEKDRRKVISVPLSEDEIDGILRNFS